MRCATSRGRCPYAAVSGTSRHGGRMRRCNRELASSRSAQLRNSCRCTGGSHRTRLRMSPGVQVNQTNSNPSMVSPMEREDGISKAPGDSQTAVKASKCVRIVRTSAETRTRSSADAIRSTFGSSVPSGTMPEAGRKSMDGSLRSNPRQMVGVNVSVGLKTDLQASRAALFFPPRSKRSIISAESGCCALISSIARS